MPTPAERQALLFVAAVAALGVGARGWSALHRDAAPSRETALAAQLAAVDSALAAGGARSRKSSAPATAKAGAIPSGRSARAREAASASDGPVDIDTADAATLDRLPGIGPALAQRIVEDRTAHGPFGSLAALERVRGIGPGLSARLRAHVTFSAPPRQSETEDPSARRGVRP